MPKKPASPCIAGLIDSSPFTSASARRGQCGPSGETLLLKKHLFHGRILLFFLTLVTLFGLFFLPTLLETFLLPRLTRDLPLTGKEIHITGISPRALQGSIRFENGDQSVLTVPRFELRYSPLGLLKGKINGLFLEGALLHLQKKADGIGINGMPAAGKTAQNSTPSPFHLPIFLEEIALRDCAVVLHDSKTAVRQLMFDARISLPLAPSDPRKNGRPGSLEIAKFLYKGKHLVSLKAELKVTDKDLTVKGAATSPLAPDLRLLFTAVSDGNSTFSLKAEIPEGPFIISTLAPLVALPPGLHLGGRLHGKASYSLGPDRPQGTASLQVQQGLIEMPEQKIALKGINLALALPDLPLLHSSPGQLLSIETMDIGDLRFAETRVHFRLQDLRTIFIEKARLAWCGGHVETDSLTLSTQSRVLKTVLSCDHLDLAQLLSQLGLNDSYGQGFLNGRLPLSISSAGIEFDNGFLFSTPGEHGRLRLSDTETLRQGMPALDRAASLDYALDALQDFSYNGLRLNFNTTGNDLLIAMQIDGKPTAPLPYGYKNGQIVKATTGPGLQHPIQLDVNFHLPSAEMFRFGKNIQTIREKM